MENLTFPGFNVHNVPSAEEQELVVWVWLWKVLQRPKWPASIIKMAAAAWSTSRTNLAPTTSTSTMEDSPSQVKTLLPDP